jgi:hypothetical protein
MAASEEQDVENQASPPISSDAAETQAPKDTTETSSSSAPEPTPARFIPNGGLQAWLQVAGAFFLYFNTWGESCIPTGIPSDLFFPKCYKRNPPACIPYVAQ